ncbi:hypothetical protein GGR58DRAFT_498112 [Xylaria digitata]|nr:hypothetical protein GGR58DRAFT_498112 [Xylaria digitata]
MQLLAIMITVLGAVSALPGSLPVITAAPKFKSLSAQVPTNQSSAACTSTDCWAEYAECYGSLTFVYLCYTPPPCGTATSPDPYICPPRTSSATPSTFSTSAVSSISATKVACTAAAVSAS